MSTKSMILVGSSALLAVLGIVLLPRFSYIDSKPALELGGEYYSRLQQGEVDDAFALYTRGFLRNAGTEWRKVITQLNTRDGNVTDFRLIAYHLTPLVTNGTAIPCVLVRYKVTRAMLSSEETLIACPRQPVAWAIAGHEILSNDKRQHFSAGVTVQEKTIL